MNYEYYENYEYYNNYCWQLNAARVVKCLAGEKATSICFNT